MDSIVLGIDLGSTRLKVAFVDDQGVPRAIPDVVDASSGPRGGRTAWERRGEGGRPGLWQWKHCLRGPDVGALLCEEEAIAVLAYHLEHACSRVSTRLRRPVAGAAIAIPASFGVWARHVVLAAADAASLELRATPPEPVAAAFLWCLDDPRDDLTVMTYDFGQSFDVGVVTRSGGELPTYSLKSCDGDLGVGDIDSCLVRWLLYRLDASGHQLRLGSAESEDQSMLTSLLDCVERTKIALSSHSRSSLRGCIRRGGESGEFSLPITREEFSELIDMKVKETIFLCRRALAGHASALAGDQDADIPPSAHRLDGRLDEIIMLGGSSRIPLVQTQLAEEFRAPLHLVAHPEHFVAMGAAAVAGVVRTAGCPVELPSAGVHDLCR